MIVLSLFLACSQNTEKEDSSVSDLPEEADSAIEDTVEEEIEIDPDQLAGTEPTENIEAPEFAALNFDETPRGRDDLIGSPTVIWFYPFANTPG